jgi:hypothetical protein
MTGRHGGWSRAVLAGLASVLVSTAAEASAAGEAGRPGPTLPELVLLAPGTRLADSAPAGWSDLVLKSIPKIESGDVGSLPAVAGATASRFRSVIVADVRADPASPLGLRLARVGLGLAVPDRDKGADTVVRPGDSGPASSPLGFVDRQVLAGASEELVKARLVARTPTFAVLAAPTELAVGGAHQKAYVLYALLVTRGDGGRPCRVKTLVWSIPAEPRRRTPPGHLAALAPGLIFRCGLDVSAERLLGTIPLGWSFAMRSLPPGEAVAVPERLKPWLTDPQSIAGRPQDFERLLRDDLVAR